MSRAGVATAAWAAWAALGLSLIAMVMAIVLWAIGAHEPFAPDIVLYPVAYLAFGAVGALIVSRQPSNRVGQLGLLTGVTGAFSGLADSWARLVEPVPGQDWAAWIATWGFPVSLAPPVLLILVFPTGRLTSRAWRFVAGLVVLACTTIAVGSALSPRLPDHPERHNPLGIEWLAGSPFDGGGVGWLLFLAGTVAAALGLVPRLRRAHGIEREQLKWITFAAALHGVAWVVLAFEPPDAAAGVPAAAVFLTLAMVPVAAGIAVLRYRLYDIDVVIRRTIVYAVVVATLAAGYAILVLLLTSALSGIAGSDALPVAISTLLIAVLFDPVRGRVRAIVDRRFYRSRYDAALTVEAFAARLREEIELEAVGRNLIHAARETVRPTSVDVWIRNRPARSP